MSTLGWDGVGDNDCGDRVGLGNIFLNWPGLDEVGINYAGMGGDSDH